jgi:hypothetical protein
MKGYVRGFPKVLWASLAVLLLSGVVLVPGALELRAEMDVPWRLPGGTRLVTAAVHALAALAFCGVLGSLAVIHMRAGWRRKKNRGSGGTLASFMVLLVLTGWGVYYAGERYASVVSIAHIVLGGGAVVAVVVHFIRAKRRAVSS